MISSRSHPVVEWLLATLIGVSFAWSCGVHLFRVLEMGRGQAGLSLLCLAGLFTAVSHHLLVGLVWPGLRYLGYGAAVFMAMGALLVVVIPIQVPSRPVPISLEITATGDKNPAAKGSEVWMQGLYLGDGSRVPASEIERIGTWEIRDGVLLSYQHQPASLRWEGEEGDLKGHGELRLTMHPWSGKVQINWNGRTETVDLYSEQGSQLVYELVSPVANDATPYRISVLLTDAIALSVAALVVGMWLTKRSSRPTARASISRWTWLMYATPCAAAWTLYLLTFWPGVMTNDSIDQWHQMLTGRFNDWHPAFHTLSNWLITRLWLSPAAVAVAQIAALSTAVGWGLTLLRRIGLPRGVAAVLCAAIALSPANGILVITLWKDVPYSIAVLLLTLLVLQVVVTRGAWLGGRWTWVALGCTAAAVALYRQNGPVAAFGTLVVLLLSYDRQRVRVGAALAIAVCIWFGVRGPVYNLLNVQPAQQTWLQPFVHQVAAHVAAGDLTPQERDSLGAIRPLEDGWGYRWSDLSPTLYSERFPFQWNAVDARTFLQDWWALTRRRPDITLQHLRLSSSLVWQIRQPLDSGWAYFPIGMASWETAQMGRNDAGIVQESWLPGLGASVFRVAENTLNISTSWLIWRPALPLYMAAFAVAILAVRSREWRAGLVLVPICLQSATLMPMVLSQELRYQYPVYLVGWLLLGAAFCKFDSPVPGNEQQAATEAPRGWRRVARSQADAHASFRRVVSLLEDP